MAQNTGAINPGTMADSDAVGTIVWATVGNAKASDNAYATADLSSAAAIVDSYSETNKDTQRGMTTKYTKNGQSFTNASKTILTSCKFYLKKEGSPTGNMVAKLYAHSGTYGTSSAPTGAALATSANVDISGLTTSDQLITFTFSDDYVMSANTYYCIVVEYPGTDAATNFGIIGTDTSSQSHSGNGFAYNAQDSSWSNYYNNDDVCFYVYGIQILTSHYLKATNFGLTVPTGAKILGIKVEVEGKSSGTDLVKEATIKIVKADGTIGATNKSTGASLATADAYVVYGGVSDLWDLTWTQADVNDVDFGVVYSIVGTGVGSIDHIRVTVYYDNVIAPADAYSSNDVFATLTGAISGALDIQISKDAGANWSSALTKTFTSTEEYLTYGAGSTELWGTTFTGDDIDDTSFRLKISHNGVSQIYKNFGFAITASYILTGLEVAVEAKYISADAIIYIDHIKIKIYYGTSILPIQAGSVAYASNGRKAGEAAGAGKGVLVYYDANGKWIASDTGAEVAA